MCITDKNDEPEISKLNKCFRFNSSLELIYMIVVIVSNTAVIEFSPY